MRHRIRNHPSYTYLPVAVLVVVALLFFHSFPDHAVEKINVADQAKTSDLSTAIIKVAKQNIPAVVHIEVTERQEVVNPFTPFENEPFFRRFFNGSEEPRKFKREVKGLGSGMIIDTEGYIITNHHVVGGATKI